VLIKGILLHQGEANAGEGTAWVNKVKTIVANLKTDLGLGDIPFIAGELIQDHAADPNAKNLNPFVNQLPKEIPTVVLLPPKVSNSDLEIHGDFISPVMVFVNLQTLCNGVSETGRYQPGPQKNRSTRAF
jgi:hypothetical protein